MTIPQVWEKVLGCWKWWVESYALRKLLRLLSKVLRARKFISIYLKNLITIRCVIFCDLLGVKTFVGTSGRVFPEKLNAADMLRSWLKLLRSFDGFNLYLNMSLKDIHHNEGFELTFEDVKNKEVVSRESLQCFIGLGGASWKKTGSNGAWYKILENLGSR